MIEISISRELATAHPGETGCGPDDRCLTAAPSPARPGPKAASSSLAGERTDPSA